MTVAASEKRDDDKAHAMTARELTHAIQRGIPVYGSAGDLP